MKWMKSLVWISVVCAFVGLAASVALAQSDAPATTSAETSADTPAPNAGSNYVDANGDGVCDNKGQGCGAKKECPNRVDANGDGVCDNKGQGCGAKGRGQGQGGSGNGACQRNRQCGGRG